MTFSTLDQMRDDARRGALGVATMERLVSFSVLTGGFCGILAAAVGLSHEFLVRPLGTLVLSFGFGCVVGAICSPIAASILRYHQFHPARWLILGLVMPLNCIAAMVSPNLLQLVLLSGMAFSLSVLTARLVLPKVWIDEGLCWKCGYDVRGSRDAGRCPECGAPVLASERMLRPNANELPRHTKTVYSLGVLLALAFAAWMLGAAWIENRPQAFDKAEWKSVPASSRLSMARGLVARGVLIGMTEADVVHTLGTPVSRYDRDRYSLSGSASIAVVYDIEEFVQRAEGSAFPQDIIYEEFDAELWATGTLHDRLRMGRSLITHRNDTLAGLSRNQVHSLLGPPDDRGMSLSYTVGRRRGAATSNRGRLQQSIQLLLWLERPPTKLVLSFEGGKVAWAGTPPAGS